MILSNAPITAARAQEDALEAAVREHARLVYAVTYSVLRNHHDAEDATQETFLRVLRFRRKLEGVENPRTWLARIAYRVAIDRRRKTAHAPLEEVGASAEQLRSSVQAADDAMIVSQMTALLGRLIAGLPPQLREVITLSTVRDLSPTEIADVLELPESAVRSRLFRARNMLKEKLTALLEGRHGS